MIELIVGTSDDRRRSILVEPFDERIGDLLEAVRRKAWLQLERDRLMRDFDPEILRKAKEIAENFCLIDCSFSYPPVRSKLEMLMGSNVVRLTDRKYMQKLIARIRQDFETAQLGRIEERRIRELMRTKRMILERLIPVQEAPSELRKYPLFQLYLYCDSIVAEKQTKRAPKKVRINEALYRILYSDEERRKEEKHADEDDVYMKTVYVNGVQTMVPMSREEMSAVNRAQDGERDIKDGYILTREAYEKLHFETDAIKELRETQTVDEMYTKALEIVGILYAFADQGRYSKKPSVADRGETVMQSDVESTTNAPSTATPNLGNGAGDIGVSGVNIDH